MNRRDLVKKQKYSGKISIWGKEARRGHLVKELKFLPLDKNIAPQMFVSEPMIIYTITDNVAEMVGNNCENKVLN